MSSRRSVPHRLWKSLASNLGIYTAIITTLALSVGLLSAVFAIFQALVLRPLTSFNSPDEILVLYTERLPEASIEGPPKLPLSLPDLLSLRQSKVFSDLAATQRIELILAGAGGTEKIRGELVTTNYFDLAKAPIIIGRDFLPNEDDLKVPSRSVIIAHDFWVRRLGGAPDVLGDDLLLNDHPFTVVGIAPPGFHGSHDLSPADLWVPLAAYREVFPFPQLLEQRDGRCLQAFGRLAPGTTAQRARSALRSIAAQLAADHPETNEGLSVQVRPLADSSNFQKGLRRGGFLLLGTTLGLLTLGAFNLTNLWMLRVHGRRKEVALNLALGAEPRHIIHQEIREALLVAALGSGAAILVHKFAHYHLWRLRPAYLEERILSSELSPSLLLLTLSITFTICFLLSFFGIRKIVRMDLTQVLTEDGESRRGEFSGHRAHPAAITLQITLTTLIFALTGLFLGALIEKKRVDPGFVATNLTLISFDLSSLDLEPEAIDQVRENLVTKLGSLPGVIGSAAAENQVLGGFRIYRSIRSSMDPEREHMAGSTRVDPGYFSTIGAEYLAKSDTDLIHQTAILNGTLADRLFPDTSAIGRQVQIDGKPTEIVGVVQDQATLALDEDPLEMIYLPWDFEPATRFTVHLRSAIAPSALLPALRPRIQEIAPALPMDALQTINDVLRETLWLPRTSTILLAMMACLALALATIGIYGASCAKLSTRSREIGIRRALGAPERALAFGFLGREILPLILGILLGMASTVLAEGYLRNIFFDLGEIPIFTSSLAVLCLFFTGMAVLLLSIYRVLRSQPESIVQSIKEPR